MWKNWGFCGKPRINSLMFLGENGAEQSRTAVQTDY